RMTGSVEASRPMRTAFLTRWVPFPPLGGAAMRNWQNINLLTPFGPVDVFAAVRRQFIPAEVAHPDAVERLWIEPVEDDAGPIPGARKSLFSIPIWLRPFCFERRVLKAFARFLDEVRPDLIVVEELALAPIVFRGLRARRHARIPVVYDAHNVESQLWEHMLTNNQRFGARSRVWLHAIKTTERRLAGRCDRIWVCSEHDRAAFAAHHGARHAIDVVNNGLSSGFYTSSSERERAAESRDFLFLGTYTYKPNEVAAKFLIEEIMPRMHQRIPGARLVLVGRGVRPWMQEAARRDPSVIVTGEVADVRPFLAAAAAMIVPLTIGSGTRLKILEAFASRCPVITTTKGAEGLGAVDETHLLYAEDPEAFLQQIERLIGDRELCRMLTNNAHELFLNAFSWDAIGRSVKASVTSMALMPASRGHLASRSEGAPRGGGEATASRRAGPETRSSIG
ncbi:glycosyltransferase family 4 protein, partial [Methylobacter sp.]